MSILSSLHSFHRSYRARALALCVSMAANACAVDTMDSEDMADDGDVGADAEKGSTKKQYYLKVRRDGLPASSVFKWANVRCSEYSDQVDLHSLEPHIWELHKDTGANDGQKRKLYDASVGKYLDCPEQVVDDHTQSPVKCTCISEKKKAERYHYRILKDDKNATVPTAISWKLAEDGKATGEAPWEYFPTGEKSDDEIISSTLFYIAPNSGMNTCLKINISGNSIHSPCAPNVWMETGKSCASSPKNGEPAGSFTEYDHEQACSLFKLILRPTR